MGEEKTRTDGSLLGAIDLSNVQTVTVYLAGNDGTKIKKQVSLEHYIAMLQGFTERRLSLASTPQGMSSIEYGGEQDFRITMYIPEDTRTTLFAGGQIKGRQFELPFPNLVFMFDVQSGVVQESKVFAVKDSARALCDSTQLFHFPYGNVYDDGKICWGANSSQVRAYGKAPKELEKAVTLFFSASMNLDLYRVGETVKEKISLEELLISQEDRCMFNYDLLSEARFHFGDIRK